MCETTSQDAFTAGSAHHTVLRKYPPHLRTNAKLGRLLNTPSFFKVSLSHVPLKGLAGEIPGLLNWSEKSLISKSRHKKFSLLTFPDLHISALPCLSGVLQLRVWFGAEGGPLEQDPFCRIPVFPSETVSTSRLLPCLEQGSGIELRVICACTPTVCETSLGKCAHIW